MDKVEYSECYELFDTKRYLENYYGPLTAFTSALKEYVRIFSQFPDGSLKVLNFGGGPDLLPLLYAAHKAKEYVHADYAQNNLIEVERWVKAEPSAFSWQGHVRQCLELENKEETVESREKRMRDVFKGVIYCDIKKEQIVPTEYRGPYDYVFCICVLDCVCQSIEAFATCIKKLSCLVKVGGYLHTEMSIDTEDITCRDSYAVGEIEYKKALKLSILDITETLKVEGFSIVSVFQYWEDSEATSKYKDNNAVVIGMKGEID